MSWLIEFQEEFLFYLFSLSSSPAFPSYKTLTHLSLLCVFCFDPFYPVINLSKLVEQNPNTSVSILQRGFLRRQQAADFFFSASQYGDVANMTSCSMESFGTVKPFCAVMLWPHPKLFLSKLSYWVYWRVLTGICNGPLPLHPTSRHLYGLSPPVEKK